MDPTTKQMMTSMFKALGIWMSIYFVLAHCFVVWNWESMETMATNVTTSSAPAAAGTLDTNSSSTETAAILQEYETGLHQLQSARIQAEERLERVQAQRAGLRTTMETTEKLIMTNNVTLTSFSAQHDKPEQPNELDAWKFLSLFNISSLSLYRMDRQLDKWMESCIQTLEQIVENENETDWKALNERLRNTLNKEPIHVSSCPAATADVTSSMRALKLIPHQAVTEWQELARQELDYLMHSIDEDYSEDDEEEDDDDDYTGRKRLPLRWQATVEDIQDELQEKLSALQHEWMQQATMDDAAATSNPASSSSSDHQKQGTCVAHATDVLPWLEAGLEAQSRRRDVRNAILQAMEIDDIDTSKIILDAVLTDEKDHLSKLTTKSKTTLRSVLDGPWTKTLAEALDTLLDKSSGYVDVWDQFLDDLAAAAAKQSESSSWQAYSQQQQQALLGQLAVQYLLQAAGHVPLTTDVLPQALKVHLQK